MQTKNEQKAEEGAQTGPTTGMGRTVMTRACLCNGFPLRHGGGGGFCEMHKHTQLLEWSPSLRLREAFLHAGKPEAERGGAPSLRRSGSRQTKRFWKVRQNSAPSLPPPPVF